MMQIPDQQSDMNFYLLLTLAVSVIGFVSSSKSWFLRRGKRILSAKGYAARFGLLF